MPKPNCGSSNNGMTAKKTFAEPNTFAKILHIFPEKLIRDWGTILEVLNCGHRVDPEKFGTFCDAWLDEFHSNKNINWNILNPTMHMVIL